MLSWQGLAKKMHGKQTAAIYVTIEDVGSAQTTQLYKDKELPLEEINAMADKMG